MTLESCKKNSKAPTQLLHNLPASQGGLGRHRCPNCAYSRGKSEITNSILSLGRFVTCNHGSAAPEDIVATLHENQGGAGRHKCVVCAYQEGRASALKVKVDKAWHYSSTTQSNLLKQTEQPRETKTPTQSPDWWRKLGEYNKKIGDAGEDLVFEFEKRRLIQLQQTELANKVCHSSREEGDHLGYDIKSFNADGSNRFIEVKSTTLGSPTPFFVSCNEVNVSSQLSPDYWIYRVYDLDLETKKASFYTINNDFKSACELEPTNYKAILKYGNE